ncbi:RNA ligase (ATP) [Pararhizobium sp. BT-229]|uniref:RNA ligase (ATP) n=1 Tax=Pararhizobium sp. BT-229 TaxID=2986923 RepID=UPI0021F725E9|nr:RNA ligase (ATP) [Pararhizobium sp. BT-229]MCV9964367.1 RNA ligase (ATP) [Pararhizobium sp. BT-229]
MSSFQVPVIAIDAIEGHPNADAIEVALIHRYRSVVRKADRYKPGDKVVYIPQASVIPDYLLKRLDLWDEANGVGRLGGPNLNRVSASKFRGILSQGICLGVMPDPGDRELVWVEGESGRISARVGDDLSEFLGITKWIPAIPEELLGEVFAPGRELTVDFDIEDVKAFPDAMIEGEEVEYTEKMHGVFTAVTILPVDDAKSSDIAEFGFGSDRNMLLYSKGLGVQGLAFKDCDGNAKSVYVRATAGLRDRLQELGSSITEPLTIMGETFGPGVQDLHYGKELGFRMFGACSGYRGGLDHYGPEKRAELAAVLGVEQVHCFYRGPFSWETLAEHTDGKTATGAGHIREGVVVTPVVQRDHIRLGRVIAKSVSEKYLLRKGGTEFS